MTTPQVQLSSTTSDPSAPTDPGSSMEDGSLSVGVARESLLPTSHPASCRQDSRALVRLVQCSQCSYPYRTPVTLPCGNSLCRQCLPPPHPRPHISYPESPSRSAGITCPFPKCGREHSIGDCSVDVVLLKVMESIGAEVARHRATSGDSHIFLEEVPALGRAEAGLAPELDLLDETPPSSQEQFDPMISASRKQSQAKHSRSLVGGRLVATYSLAELGELHYTSDVRYHSADLHESIDDDFISTLKVMVHEKVECQVCYNMLLEPITTPCGHTFCRKCLARILDHSTLCPHCRRRLSLPPITITRIAGSHWQPLNFTVSAIISSLYPVELQARRDAAELEERSGADSLDTSLFVCTVSYPQMPTILHIFEPRYRLMVRRALEGNRQFGMLAYNQHYTPQGSLGQVHFCEIGTMLYIEQCEALEDGRMFLICKGLYRFKVLAHGSVNGYAVGQVQRHDDVEFAEEERIEALETTQPPSASPDADLIDRTPTAELLAQCLDFINRAQAQSARWLQGNIQAIYGPPPNDAALFPYWFASVVPLQDDKKYKLLPTMTVRERLKITRGWIRQIERQPWPQDLLSADEDDSSDDGLLTVYYEPID